MNRSIIRRVLLVGSATALALATGIGSAQAGGTPGWRTVATVSVKPQTGLLGVAASGARHAWAVGVTASRDGNTLRPLVESWDGSAWSQVSLPAPVVSALGQTDPVLVTAAALGPANVWAFSAFGGWLHGKGSTWTAGTFFGARDFIQASLAAGKDTVWAFGGRSSQSGSVPVAAFHAGSHGWKRTPVPGKGVIVAASAVSGRDIWAVIGNGADGLGDKIGGLVRWSGGHWQQASLPAALRNGSLGSVLARSDTNVWVGGAVRNVKKGTTEAVGHWNGRSWTVVKLRAAASAARYRVISMATDGAGGIWAVGLCIASKCPGGRFSSRLWHETAGRWSLPVQQKLASGPHALLSLAPVRHSVWGVGVAQTGRSGLDGLIALWGPIPR